MIPLRDTIRSKRTPVVNIGIIVACVGVFLYELSLGPRLEPFLRHHAVIPASLAPILAGRIPAPDALSTLVTSTFLHGGWLHLLGNMLFLYVFGDNVEDRFGHGPYLVFYLLCGIGAALAQIWIAPLSTVPMLGASGAIAGVLGAYFILYPKARVLTIIPLFIFFPIMEISAFFFLGFWILMQVVYSVFASDGTGGGVAWWAHMGGFAAGIVLLPVFLITAKLRGYR